MRPYAPAAVLAILAVAGGVLAILASRDGPVAPEPAETLEPLVESPRPPVAAETREPFLRAPPAPVPGSRRTELSRAALLEARNACARAHRDAVAQYEAGRVSILAVEQAEMRLLDARHDLGELDPAAWHRARVVLLARGAEAARLLSEAGHVPAQQAQEALLAVERERLLAGDANRYAEQRDRFLVSTKDRHRTIADAGFAAPKDLETEYARLEADFPAAGDLRRAAGR